VRVMVRVLEYPHQVRVDLAHHGVEGRGIGKSADRDYSATRKRRRAFVPFPPRRGNQTVRAQARVKDAMAPQHFHLAWADGAAVVSTERHDYDGVGTPYRGQRFSHRSGREHTAVPEAALVADQDQIEISFEPRVLEAII